VPPSSEVIRDGKFVELTYKVIDRLKRGGTKSK